MRHSALRRTTRPFSKGELQNGADPLPLARPLSDPAAQNRIAPNAPADGEHNQGGIRPEGIDYQRNLGLEQDA